MALKMFCDRCGVDITNKTSSALRGIADADAQKNGILTLDADLCPSCYRDLVRWVDTASAAPRQKRKAS
jgi:hypothetical protein